MQYQISAEAINAICNVFASSEESATPFATQASSFVNARPKAPRSTWARTGCYSDYTASS